MDLNQSVGENKPEVKPLGRRSVAGIYPERLYDRKKAFRRYSVKPLDEGPMLSVAESIMEAAESVGQMEDHRRKRSVSMLEKREQERQSIVSKREEYGFHRRPRRSSVHVAMDRGGRRPTVYLTIQDPIYSLGLRNYGIYPVMPGQRPPDGTHMGRSNVVYVIGGTMEATYDSTVEGSEHGLKVVLEEKKQSSVVTIFAIWNTMMGTSILAMPWAIQQAGFGFGILLLIMVAAIACYTGYLTIKTTEDLRIIRDIPKRQFLDFGDACEYHLGKAGRMVALIFSQLALAGAVVVYYVLLTNFLFYTGDFIYHKAIGADVTDYPPITIFNRTYDDVICRTLPELSNVPNIVRNTTVSSLLTSTVATTTEASDETSLYEKIWNIKYTVPVWLILVVFPLISIRSPAFLGKFAAFASVSVLYLLGLVIYKTIHWGIHLDFTSDHPFLYVPQYQSSFPSLTGICALAFFIHNSLQAITRPQKHPENNGRDIVLAFTGAASTYLIIGVIFYVGFPLAKSCIEDNFLNNLVTDIPVFIGRFLLLFLLCTVFPMLIYVLRSQIMYAIFKNTYPSFWHVFGLHVIAVGAGVLFAIFLPKIGTIIRFIGSLCGWMYVFTLPPLITILNKRALICHRSLPPSTANIECSPENGTDPLLKLSKEKEWPDSRAHTYWWIRVAVYSVIILLGLLNFIGQFVVLFI
ncbi:unnamed protein product [Calicophoron daubneyi]|uniref:Amino acid transporter transmembrane domain-containing protein n=1 Tax=Calicophoron daubneyi TaxID=300641 RepID=A0AAV2T614_CALDB